MVINHEYWPQLIWEHSHGTPITNKDGISINKSEVVPPSNVSMQYWRGHDKTIRAGKDPSWNSLAVNQLREQLLSWTNVCCSSAARAMPLGHSTWSPKFCDQAINLSIYVQYTLMLSGRTLIRFGSRCLLPLLFRVLRRVLPGLFDQLRDPRLCHSFNFRRNLRSLPFSKTRSFLVRSWVGLASLCRAN